MFVDLIIAEAPQLLVVLVILYIWCVSIYSFSLRWLENSEKYLSKFPKVVCDIFKVLNRLMNFPKYKDITYYTHINSKKLILGRRNGGVWNYSLKLLIMDLNFLSINWWFLEPCDYFKPLINLITVFKINLLITYSINWFKKQWNMLITFFQAIKRSLQIRIRLIFAIFRADVNIDIRE